jgi:hypothetical protein
MSGEAIRIAATIPALMVSPHPGRLIGHQDGGDDVRAHDRMVPKNVPLPVREGSRLQKDLVANADLPDVVDEPGLAQEVGVLGRPPELQGKASGKVGHAVGVKACERILGLEGPGE